MLDSVFPVESVRERHQKSPCFSERERFLTYLCEIGIGLDRVRSIASMLLHVVRLLKLDSARPVEMNEIVRGCKLWVEDAEANRHRSSGAASPHTFRRVATRWLRFQGLLLVPCKPAPPFGDFLSQFLNVMRSQRGLALNTVESYQSRISAFLIWLHSRGNEFSNVRALDIEEYLKAKGSDGWSRSSVAAHCIALRMFFGYAEQQRWCTGGIRASILGPRVPRVAENLSGPRWEDVRRVIASIGNLKPSDLRAKAMFLLFSIYGFRAAEVSGLTLEDVDWHKETIMVRRAKRGKTQRFPLQSEIGEAIALYLEKARPKCLCRRLFVTLRPPYRPVSGKSMSVITSPRIKRLGIATDEFGPHTLRRACATQLLRTGSSLKDIADFLGHSDLRSVSNYAKFDLDSLRSVAKFSLRSVL